jgi:single-strand DNA-binding protein
MPISYEMTGLISVVFATERKTDRFKSREFIINTEDEKPQTIIFEATQERTEMLEGLRRGDRVTVHFDIRCREFKQRYYTTLNACKVVRDAQPQERLSSQA